MKIPRFIVHDVPFLIPLLGIIARFIGGLAGWKIIGKLPDVPKMVLIGVPHTSNWDYMIFLYGITVLRLRVIVLAKNTLFWWPLGAFLKFFGAVPVDRSKKIDRVQQGIDYMNSVEKGTLLITPEGTRSYQDTWKSGFYHIAYGAKVPLVLGKLDFDKKIVYIGDIFEMTGDYDKDIVAIRDYYKDCVPYNPDKFAF